MSGEVKQWDQLIFNVNLATMVGDIAYGAITQAALAIADQKIAWLGPVNELPDAPQALATEVFRGDGWWCMPGLVDCHTHLLFAGNRADEFERRLTGTSYETIAAEGGGIMSTVRATRAASERDLLDYGGERMRQMLAHGTTTLEIKSGYGLDVDTELKMLRVARRLAERFPQDIKLTFLGLHAVPAEFEGDSNGYVNLVCNEILPAAASEQLVDAVDAYCESLAFSEEQVRRCFDRAQELGLPVKLHADQLSDSNGAGLAAHYSALSADHLEYSNAAGIEAMAAAGTTAVLLPAAYYTLGQTQPPPIDILRKHKVPMAVATDCNPGTSPIASLVAVMNQACSLFGLTPEEALLGATINGSRALAMDDRIGTLEVGKQADLALWDIGHPAELSWWIGGRRCKRLYKAGERVY